MHPLVIFAISDLERSQRARENELIWRNARAADVPAAARERDRRWARAIVRLAAADRRTGTVKDDGTACATA